MAKAKSAAQPPGSILVEAEILLEHLPIGMGPRHAVARKLHVAFGLDLPFIAHTDLGTRRHSQLHGLAVRIHARMAAAVGKRYAFGPLWTQADLLRERRHG